MVRSRPQSRPFDPRRVPTATPRASGHGSAWQLVCIDCGTTEMIVAPHELTTWTCSSCLRRRALEDKAFVDQQNIRRCHRCKKKLTRMNFGPQCFACDLEGPPESASTLTNDERMSIMARHAEGALVGDLSDEFGLSERAIKDICRGIVPENIRDDILADFEGGLTHAEVARQYHVSDSTVRAICGPARIPDFSERNQAIYDEYQAGGVTYDDLGAKYGMSRHYAYQIIAGQVGTKNMPRGESCSNDGCGNRVLARGLCGKHYMRARRTNQLRDDQIRAEYAEGGATHRTLSVRYGLAQSTIWDILNRERT